MRTQVLSAFLLVATSAGVSALAASPAGYALPDAAPLVANFSVSSTTTVPGTTLKPGSYVIRVVDHLPDRTILRIETADGKQLTTFLGLPSRRLSNSGRGPVDWATGPDHDKALRGFSFPGDYAVEFVYPKAQAVKLAVANSNKVEAIDPASDNLPAKDKNLSREDMRIVTLWTLAPTTVGPNDNTPAISAVKYEAPAAPSAPTPTYEARNEPPAVVNRPAPVPRPRVHTSAPAESSAAAPAPKRKPVLTALPHTASDLPLILLGGLVSLTAAAGLRTRRFFGARA